MKNKYTKTELPITIITDDEHKTGDNLELTRQRIEKAAMYLQSLFNTTAFTIENMGDFDDFKLEAASWGARHLCEIGYAVADSILASASCLTEFQPDEIKSEEPPNLDSLANQISFLLNNPDLPKPLFDNFQRAINDFFNNDIDQSEVIENEKSPEYISRVLRGFKKSEAKND